MGSLKRTKHLPAGWFVIQRILYHFMLMNTKVGTNTIVFTAKRAKAAKKTGVILVIKNQFL